MTRIVELTQAVTDFLSASALMQNINVIRRNFVALRAENILQPVCVVSPVAYSTQVETRGSWINVSTIGITLAQTLNTMTIEEQDNLITISEQIPRELLKLEYQEIFMLDINDGTSRVVFSEEEMETGTAFVAWNTVTFKNED